VYEEELDDRDGFRWSPNGNYIAYWQSKYNIGTFCLMNMCPSIPRPIPLPLIPK